MTDSFKEKLAAYEDGELEGEELAEFEEELAKLEKYNKYMDADDIQKEPYISGKKRKKILKRSKWKARFQTAFTAIGILLLVTFISSVLTVVYYSWGNPDRSDVFRSVIDHTMTITDPYGSLSNTRSTENIFFTVDMTKSMNKQVGKEIIQVGELKKPFLFSFMGFSERELNDNQLKNPPAFIYPGSDDRGMSDWNRLEHLPEGTVVSAYVSFNELIDTSTVFQQFMDKDLDLIWLAVDTGAEDNDFGGIVLSPIGFPTLPIWHVDDLTQDSYEEEKGFLFSKTVTETFDYPSFEEGDTDILQEQFLKTLNTLETHEKKVNYLYNGHHLDLDERINYLATNGVQHYGIVITGPTKEVLELHKKDIVSSLEIDEIGFWNW